MGPGAVITLVAALLAEVVSAMALLVGFRMGVTTVSRAVTETAFNLHPGILQLVLPNASPALESWYQWRTTVQSEGSSIPAAPP